MPSRLKERKHKKNGIKIRCGSISMRSKKVIEKYILEDLTRDPTMMLRAEPIDLEKLRLTSLSFQ